MPRYNGLRIIFYLSANTDVEACYGIKVPTLFLGPEWIPMGS